MCYDVVIVLVIFVCFFFQAEDGIRDLVRSRGLGDVYKRQVIRVYHYDETRWKLSRSSSNSWEFKIIKSDRSKPCLLYTSDAADERSSVDLGGRRIIKKKNQQ